MAKLVYWICDVREDSKAYNIRARTKKEAARLRTAHGAEHYDEPKCCRPWSPRGRRRSSIPT